MKTKALLIPCLALVAGVMSCRKTDSDQLPVSNPAFGTLATTTSGSGWNVLNNWQSAKTSSSTVGYGSMPVDNITSDVFDSGLVLVYKKTGTTIQALPYEESGNVYWSYQVAGKSILITREGNNSLQAPGDNSFLYLILSAAQLTALENQGYTRDKLMQVSYETVTDLLKK